MNDNYTKVGMGGGCHWCTEAVFQSLRGVKNVKQGWVASFDSATAFSEAVIVEYDPKEIPLEVLVSIHLHTHKSTSAHPMRKKYRSAVYVYNEAQEIHVANILQLQQHLFDRPLVTQILRFSAFKPSRKEILNYYYSNPSKPFCKTYIAPKLRLLLTKFNTYTRQDDLQSVLPSESKDLESN